ncbi:MAG: CRISPR-associated endonuclease Cas2 [Paludibacter sp. 47-17]|nr:MAG: CRISPR-associated endonuclease Cas2 [Paludibacter sp. 47-17]
MANKKEVGFIEMMRKFYRSGLEGSPPPNGTTNSYEDLPAIRDRIDKILGIVTNNNRKAGNMIFFVMYDIEDNKVRRYIAKYLLKMGCTRVQRSIFLADLNGEKYNQIRTDLSAVQAAYENADSILIVPISTDLLSSMRVIGQTIDIELITNKKNTLFF